MLITDWLKKLFPPNVFIEAVSLYELDELFVSSGENNLFPSISIHEQ